ncbi:MAG TPA: serpin family protein [Streptosporangiaceae bacterium]|nr:serpin family protein [Streptosporangiaceae bacterium]
MSKTAGITAALAAAGVLAAGCGTATPGPQPAGLIRGVAFHEPPVSPRPYGAADTAFGMNLLGAWCQADPHGNLVLSPASLATGLGLAYLGARGATAADMARVLHLPAAAGQRLEAGLQARSAALRGLDGPGVTVADSDQVWADPSLRTDRGYLNAVATGYDAGIRHVPLMRRPGLAAREINDAIAAATRGHITGLLSPKALDGTGWVLTDALYLHAAWARPFSAAQTSTGGFTSATGTRVSAKYLQGGPFRTAEADGWTAASLPYRGGKLAMLALLPPGGSAACPTASPATMSALTTQLAGRAAVTEQIALPRVSLNSQLSLNDLLSKLGMSRAFGPGADFAGLSPQACCIGLVEHAATLKVGEKGTVATAATAVGVEPTAMKLPQARLWFSRPYLLMVTDKATGEPLFLARVTDPAAH